jgi:hypothetical protein
MQPIFAAVKRDYPDSRARMRRSARITGLVQGVGFRVRRQAAERTGVVAGWEQARWIGRGCHRGRCEQGRRDADDAGGSAGVKVDGVSVEDAPLRWPGFEVRRRSRASSAATAPQAPPPPRGGGCPLRGPRSRRTCPQRSAGMPELLAGISLSHLCRPKVTRRPSVRVNKRDFR